MFRDFADLYKKYQVKRILSNILLFLLVSLVLVIVILWGGWTWDEYREKIQAHTLVEQLEKYKSVHHKYPDDLSSFKLNDLGELSYAADSTGQSFTVSYIVGITRNHVVKYESATHKWERAF